MLKLEEVVQARFGSDVKHPELLPLATQVYGEAQDEAKDDNYAIDIVTIITIVNLLYQIGKIIWNWYNRDTDAAIKKSRKLSWWQRFVLWTVVRKNVAKKDRGYIYDGVVGMVYKFTDEERKLWFESVQS